MKAGRRSMPTPLGQIHDGLLGDLAHAIRALDAPSVTEEALHDARKDIKKVRAALRGLSASLGRPVGRQQRLRQPSRLLGAIRDADVLPEVLHEITREFPGVVPAAASRTVDRGLSGRVKAARQHLPHAAREAVALFRAEEKRLQRGGPPADGSRFFEDGLPVSYRRARRAGRDLNVEGDDADFHRWRRRVKDHWYQLRLVALPRSAGKYLERLDRLQETLGAERDCTLLSAVLLTDAASFGGPRSTAPVLGCLRLRQRRLREESLKLRSSLFEPSPDRFAKTLQRWMTRQQTDRAGRSNGRRPS